MQGEPPGDAAGEVLLTHAKGSPNLAAVVARGVRWVHTYGTGVNDFPFQALGAAPAHLLARRLRGADRGVGAGGDAGSREAPAGDVALRAAEALEHRERSAACAAARSRSSASAASAARSRASRWPSACACARCRRTRRAESRGGRRGRPRPRARCCADADHLVLAAPVTRATRHLIDARALAAREARACTWSTSRAARSSTTTRCAPRSTQAPSALASLDCVEPEPLPAGHWLYAHPRVRVSAAHLVERARRARRS